MLVCGLAPALSGSSLNVGRVMNEFGRGAMDSPARRRLRSALVVAEIAVAMLLLVGAGLAQTHTRTERGRPLQHWTATQT